MVLALTLSELLLESSRLEKITALEDGLQPQPDSWFFSHCIVAGV